jgi:hypothetical protein
MRDAMGGGETKIFISDDRRGVIFNDDVVSVNQGPREVENHVFDVSIPIWKWVAVRPTDLGWPIVVDE